MFEAVPGWGCLYTDTVVPHQARGCTDQNRIKPCYNISESPRKISLPFNRGNSRGSLSHGFRPVTSSLKALKKGKELICEQTTQFPSYKNYSIFVCPRQLFQLKGETEIVLMDIKFYIHAKQAVVSVLHIIFY